MTLGLTGSIRVVSKTCTTSDVSVPLGRSKIMPLKGGGMSLPAVNFEIRLTDCPGFPGSIASGGGGAVSSQNGGVIGPSRSPNTRKIRIDSVATAINASKGVLSLTAEKGKRVATGVGVQLLDESGQPWILSQDVGVPNLNANTTSLTIKLGARYLQTAAEVKPGLSNAVATYTLNYQ
ncbi:fimbrial protein [Janthinobacterium sp. BJB401]|uniref:fimbrial protein n=1 Tax=Janthinobacterium sp. BJB401 TaxID=2745934 RepID=UPI0015950BED|nr:type 1 fimbrial protein [Janthinobacterium sp. BJB401]